MVSVVTDSVTDVNTIPALVNGKKITDYKVAETSIGGVVGNTTFQFPVGSHVEVKGGANKTLEFKLDNNEVVTLIGASSGGEVDFAESYYITGKEAILISDVAD